jgi:hypothetical protein
VRFTTAAPKPSGTINVDGVDHDVWCHWDIALERVEDFERILPRLRDPSSKITAERVADVLTLVQCVAPTIPPDEVAQMRPRRLGQMYLHILPLVFLDPLAPSRPTASQPGVETEAPAPSDPTPSDADSPARSAGRTRKSTP